MRISAQLPDPARADAGLVLSSERAVGGADLLVPAADAVIAAWDGVPWPAGLLTYSLFLDADGDRLLYYAQWTDAAAADRFEGSGEHISYRLYRGGRSTEGEVPGAIVAVRVDTDDDALARAWVDAVFAALAGTDGLPAGGLGGFFHVSTDGRHVLNYAEWISAEAHRQALARSGGRGIASGPLWDKVQTMPGVRPQSVTRYHLHRTLTPD
jgi:hypothetical protein